jgi:hypothetical protein
MSKLETVQQSVEQSNKKMQDVLMQAEQAEMVTMLGSQLGAYLEQKLKAKLIETQAQSAVKIHERLDHIEKNLILQQPSVKEFTKQVYPHIEATITRCETAEERQTKLEELLRQMDLMFAGFVAVTEETLTKQQKENNDLFLLTQTKIINEYQGYQQLIHSDLENLRKTEQSCQQMVAECRKMTEQFSRPYEMASKIVQELSETARVQVEETKEMAMKAVEESRTKFLKTFRRLDTTLTSHPFLILGSMFLMTIVLSFLMNLATGRWFTEKMVSNSIEASTANTQESLQPILEKIQAQTKALDLTYQQSENWEYYLSTLSYDQAQKLRWKVQQQVLERKQKIANQNLRAHQ